MNFHAAQGGAEMDFPFWLPASSDSRTLGRPAAELAAHTSCRALLRAWRELSCGFET